MSEQPVNLSSGLPETVLPAVPEGWRSALAAALGAEPTLRRAEVALVCAAHPHYFDAWAALSELARDDTEAYAYARVGYHRGLDALRAAGWRGNGYVRASHEDNRGFLSALNALRKAAAAIGEEDEEERCALFLVQLDPDWGRRFS